MRVANRGPYRRCRVVPAAARPAWIETPAEASVDGMTDSRSGGVSAALRFASRYGVILLTLVVGLMAGGAALGGFADVARWIAGGYAFAVAAAYAVQMIRRLAHGRFGIDILAVLAIAATVLVDEMVAAFVAVLMMVGGQALEDFANRHARHELDALLQRDPRTAHPERDGQIEQLPIDTVQLGERLVVRPSEVVPVEQCC